MDFFVALLVLLLIVVFPYVSFYFKERLRFKAWQKQFDKKSKK